MMNMYMEPEMEIIKFNENVGTTFGVSDENFPGTGPSIDFDDTLQ